MSDLEEFSFDHRLPATNEILSRLQKLFQTNPHFERSFKTFLRSNAPAKINPDEFITKLHETDVVPNSPVAIWERFPVSHERVAFAIEEVCRQMPYTAKRLLYALEQSREDSFIKYILNWLNENYPSRNTEHDGAGRKQPDPIQQEGRMADRNASISRAVNMVVGGNAIILGNVSNWIN